MRLLRVVHHQFDVLRAVYIHMATVQPGEHPLLAAAAEQRSKQKKNKIDKLK